MTRSNAGGLLAAAPLPSLESRALLAHVLGCTREQLIAHPEQPVTATDASQFGDLVERRVSGEPVAYLLGEKAFHGYTFEVTPAVLIPRPETELLVDIALRVTTKSRANVLDLGTGSGCIAITLGLERPEWRIVATDSSIAAIAVARANAEKVEARNVDFLQGDWFAAIPPDARFDLIVSNPPYVAEADPHLADLSFEPISALTAGHDGLTCLRTITQEASSFLVPGGWLVLEHGFDQGHVVRGLLAQGRWQRIEVSADLAGIDRVTCAQKLPFSGAKLPETIGSNA